MPPLIKKKKAGNMAQMKALTTNPDVWSLIPSTVVEGELLVP